MSMGRHLGFLFIALLAASAAVGVYIIYQRQHEVALLLGGFEQRLETAAAPVAEKIIEKVSVKANPWYPVQQLAKDTVVQIFAPLAKPDILRPYVTPEQGRGEASGFFIDGEGHIITNAHVVEYAQGVWIQVPATGKSLLDAEIVGVCPDRDLALLKLTDEARRTLLSALGLQQTPHLALGNSDEVYRSDELMVLGYPLGQQALKSTTGVVSGREHMNGHYLIQISAAINPGSSGCPVLNADGKVVGIAHSGIVQAQNVGYVIPVNDLKLILKDLFSTRLLRKPFVGFLINNGSDALARYLGNPLPSGSYIVEVVPGSPLEKAGAHIGDMIYALDGMPIDAYGELTAPWSEDKVSLTDALSRLAIGHTMRLTVYRQGKRHEIDVTLAASDLAPVRKLYTGHGEGLPYEVIAGLVIQPLSLNHLPPLVSIAPQLTRYLDIREQAQPALVVTHVQNNSLACRSRVIPPGAIIDEINGMRVQTLEQLHEALKKGAEHDKQGNRYLRIKTKDKMLVAFPYEQVMWEQRRLARLGGYELSPTMEAIVSASEQQAQVPVAPAA